MVEARRIAQVLGLNKGVTSVRRLSEAVEHGLPKRCLKNTVRHVSALESEQRRVMYELVPLAAYRRRKDRLNLEESQRTERLARVIATAEYVWDDEEAAKRFLSSPQLELGHRTPLETASTELGARQVEELLARLLHGLPV